MDQTPPDMDKGIANLSISDRPFTICERFDELYDNQWTDAYEVVLEKVTGSTDEEKEKECVRILLKILMASMKFCEMEAKAQDEEIKAALFRTGMRDRHARLKDDVAYQLMSIKKAVAPDNTDIVYKKYLLQTGKETLRQQLTHQLTDYVKECVRMCWLINMQYPPIVFGPNVDPGDPFNKSLYREYTSSGQKIDYVVWPPLLLHSNGPVLTKGVAQGLKVQAHTHTAKSLKRLAVKKKSSPVPPLGNQDTGFKVVNFLRPVRPTAVDGPSSKQGLAMSKDSVEGLRQQVQEKALNYIQDPSNRPVQQIDFKRRDAFSAFKRPDVDKRNQQMSRSKGDGEERPTVDNISQWRQNHHFTDLDIELGRGHQIEKPMRYVPSFYEYKHYLNCVKHFGHMTARASLGDDLYNACVLKEKELSS